MGRGYVVIGAAGDGHDRECMALRYGDLRQSVWRDTLRRVQVVGPRAALEGLPLLRLYYGNPHLAVTTERGPSVIAASRATACERRAPLRPSACVELFRRRQIKYA